jgi:hypothetical protein
MDLLQFFGLISNQLIPLMLTILVLALVLRYLAFRTGRRDKVYFTTFAKVVDKVIDSEQIQEKVENIEVWLDSLYRRVVAGLPERSVRQQQMDRGNRQSFREYADGKQSVIHGLKQNADVFYSSHRPDCHEIANRILNQDRSWKTVLGFIPVEMLIRFMEILPGLFIVGGIFGTFLGITAALPLIATIDMTNLDNATPILNQFVANVAFSMNTSIVGIVCSVVLQILNTAFPLNQVREEVESSLEACLESIWYRLHGNQLTYAEIKIIGLLSKIADVEAKYPQKMKKAS